jgi:hypothetical protein
VASSGRGVVPSGALEQLPSRRIESNPNPGSRILHIIFTHADPMRIPLRKTRTPRTTWKMADNSGVSM